MAVAEAVRTPFNGKADWSNPYNKISQYFTVQEVTQGDKRRIPIKGSAEENNIIRLAKELDKMRLEWGSPVGITSWYRPIAINRSVGGVSNSQHIYGLAADVYTMDGRDDEFEKWLNAHWGGALGYGVASGRGFTHLDIRGLEGGWRKGAGAVRWAY